MAIQTPNGFACGYCGKEFKSQVDADKCKEEHNLIYVPMTTTELNRIINFIYLKEDKLIPEGLVEKLGRYARQSVRLDKK